MQRHILGILLKSGWTQYRRQSEQKEKGKEKEAAKTPDAIKRLEAIGHDLTRIPSRFCDSATSFEPINDLILLGIAEDQVTEKTYLVRNFSQKKKEEQEKEKEEYANPFFKDGRYINPHNRCDILIPLLFNKKLEKELLLILQKIFRLQETPPTSAEELNIQKASIASELATLSGKISTHQKELLAAEKEMTLAINNVSKRQEQLVEAALQGLYALGSDIQPNLDSLKEEAAIITSNLIRFKKEEAVRSKQEAELREQYESYIASLERIHSLKVGLDTQPGDTALIESLKKELFLFIKNTLPLITEYERDEVLGIEEKWLKELMTSSYEKILLLHDDLKKMGSEEGKLSQELIELDLSAEELAILADEQQFEKKILLTRQIIDELENFIAYFLPTSEEEHVFIEEQKNLLASLIVSLASHGETKTNAPMVSFEKEQDHIELHDLSVTPTSIYRNNSQIFSVFASRLPALMVNDEKGKEKEISSPKPKRPGNPSED